MRRYFPYLHVGGASVKLLIVDDSSAVYGRLLEMLGGVEHLTALSIARSLREAVEKGRQLCPDAVVLDVRLPDGSGLDALAAIKQDSPNTRVYIFTNQVEFRDKALRTGADGFFDKSLEFEALVAQLLGTDAHAGLENGQ
jgi:DNA-binding NarL/FixJ family response regulator